MSAVIGYGVSEFRLLVCGGRDYNDYKSLCEVLDRVHAKVGVACVIHGAARGADLLAAKWAESRGIDDDPYPADWSQGRKAGPIRNKWMLDEGKPDGVVAFPGGRGTAGMVKLARDAGVTVMVIK